jgi:hypothetical protein
MASARDEPMTFLSLAIDLLNREAMVEKFWAGPLNTGGGCTDYNMKRRIQYESAFSGTGVMNRKALVP